MIRIAEIRDGRTLEVEVSGKLTGEDYNEVLVPSIQSMFSEFGKLKLIIILQRDFDGFDFQAMWSDLKMSILHWNSFDRIAIITDKTWVKNIYHGNPPIFNGAQP